MSQRTILLIDPDRDFHNLLVRELGPYGFAIVVDTSADPLAQVGKLAATALVIAVDEPDKRGYATFNKAKKGVAAQLPVVLVTSTVPADAFAAHRKLKVRADEYLDKRDLSTAELLGKFDNLIGLGDLSSDGELAIPVEVDEVAIDDEVLVDELESGSLDLSDSEEFNEGQHTQHAAATFDDSIDAETDAAFAMLTDSMPLEDAQAALAAAAPRAAARDDLTTEPPPFGADDAFVELEPLVLSDAAIALPDAPPAPAELPPIAAPPPAAPPPAGSDRRRAAAPRPVDGA
jgi:CheY-like chemotaxis protein